MYAGVNYEHGKEVTVSYEDNVQVEEVVDEVRSETEVITISSSEEDNS